VVDAVDAVVAKAVEGALDDREEVGPTQPQRTVAGRSIAGEIGGRVSGRMQEHARVEPGGDQSRPGRAPGPVVHDHQRDAIGVGGEAADLAVFVEVTVREGPAERELGGAGGRAEERRHRPAVDLDRERLLFGEVVEGGMDVEGGDADRVGGVFAESNTAVYTAWAIFDDGVLRNRLIG
jgi:hypothetical protein